MLLVDIMRNRSRLVITFDMLDCIRIKMSKTHIMYDVFMSYGQVNNYIAWFKELDLVEEHIEGRAIYYSLKEKGEKLLSLLRPVIEILYPKAN